MCGKKEEGPTWQGDLLGDTDSRETRTGWGKCMRGTTSCGQNRWFVWWESVARQITETRNHSWGMQERLKIYWQEPEGGERTGMGIVNKLRRRRKGSLGHKTETGSCWQEWFNTLLSTRITHLENNIFRRVLNNGATSIAHKPFNLASFCMCPVIQPLLYSQRTAHRGLEVRMS